jgi:hypothetical protein
MLRCTCCLGVYDAAAPAAEHFSAALAVCASCAVALVDGFLATLARSAVGDAPPSVQQRAVASVQHGAHERCCNRRSLLWLALDASREHTRACALFALSAVQDAAFAARHPPEAQQCQFGDCQHPATVLFHRAQQPYGASVCGDCVAPAVGCCCPRHLHCVATDWSMPLFPSSVPQ